MKLYDGIGPNPFAARIALAEKGLAYERVAVDIVKNESRTPEYLARVNPTGTIPALETDDGMVIAEVTAIAEYLDEVQPQSPLIGATVEERAATRMWARRLDLELCMPLGIAFQAGRARKFFEGRKDLPGEQAAADFLAIGLKRLGWLEGLLAGRPYVCGDRFSWADVPLFAYLEFFGARGRQEDSYPKGGWLEEWRARVRARPGVLAAGPAV